MGRVSGKVAIVSGAARGLGEAFARRLALGDQGGLDEIQAVVDLTPTKRWGEPDEISHMVLLLASDEMKYATGAEFVIDGGLTSR